MKMTTYDICVSLNVSFKPCKWWCVVTDDDIWVLLILFRKELKNFPTSGVNDSVVVYPFKMCPVSSPPSTSPLPAAAAVLLKAKHRSDPETAVLRSYSDNRSTWLRFLYHNIRWNVMNDSWALLSAGSGGVYSVSVNTPLDCKTDAGHFFLTSNLP